MTAGTIILAWAILCFPAALVVARFIPSLEDDL